MLEALFSASRLDNYVKIGTGGWGYLPIEEGDRLRAYAKLFDYVEVNTTFYHLPRLDSVRSWRRRVPSGFTFSVKCNRLATHDLGLMPFEETFRVLERMVVSLGARAAACGTRRSVSCSDRDRLFQ